MVSEENIRFEYEDKYQKTCKMTPWERFDLAIQAPNHYLLFRGREVACCLPKKGFDGDAAFERCAEVIRRHIRNFRVKV